MNRRAFLQAIAAGTALPGALVGAIRRDAPAQAGECPWELHDTPCQVEAIVTIGRGEDFETVEEWADALIRAHSPRTSRTS